MRISELNYELDPENIACEPPEIRLGRRDLGRMLVVDRAHRTMADTLVLGLPNLLSPGDVLILNNSKRIPGVLHTRTQDNAQVDIRVAKPEGECEVRARLYPTHHISIGTTLIARDNSMIEIIADVDERGLYLLRFSKTWRTTLHACGLPITSFFSHGFWALDNYNNLFATEEGFAESPMAGIHFTHSLLDTLRDVGVNIGFITLHAVGSWLPFAEEEVKDHIPYQEFCRVPEEVVSLVEQARQHSRRVVAVGTTVMRALETATNGSGNIASFEGYTNLYIRPGHNFRCVTSYFTNFHPARSSLMVLDAAFCGMPFLMDVYATARARRFLFHEFGDAVLYL